MPIRSMFRIDFQLVAVSMTLLGSSLLTTVFRFYYVRVFLEKYDLSQKWLSFAQLFFIIANIIIEPFLGFLQDFGCARFCKNRRKMILFAGPLLVAAYLTPWFSPYDPNEVAEWVPGAHLMFVLFFWNLFFVLALSAYCGLYAEQSTDHSYRVRLYKYEAIARFVGNLVIFPVDKISGSLRDFHAFQYCAIAVGVIAAVCFITTGLTASDHVAQARLIEEEEDDMSQNDPISHDHPGSSEGTVSSISSDRSQNLSSDVVENGAINPSTTDRYDTSVISVNSDDLAGTLEPRSCNPFAEAATVFSQLFRNPDFVSAVGSNLCGWMRAQAFWNFLGIHAEILISGNILPPGSFRIALYYQVCVLAPLLLTAFAVSPLTHRYGCYWMIQVSNVLTWVNSAVALLLVKWTGYNIAFATLFGERNLIGWMVFSVLLVFQGLFHMILGEVIDEDSKKHRRKLPPSTFIYTLNGMVVRMSIGLAPIIVVQLLNLGEYNIYRTRLEDASDTLKFTSFLISTCLPSFFSFFGFLALLPYKIRRSA